MIIPDMHKELVNQGFSDTNANKIINRAIQYGTEIVIQRNNEILFYTYNIVWNTFTGM